MYRILISGTATRSTEGKLAEAVAAFVDKLEKIEGHGVSTALFEGSIDFLRLRGTDNTLVEAPGANDEVVPAIFQTGGKT